MFEKNKRLYVYLPIILSVIFILGMFAGRYLPGGSLVFIHNIPLNNKLESIIEYIQEEYVDSVSKDELIELSIPAILQNLDPHYLTS